MSDKRPQNNKNSRNAKGGSRGAEEFAVTTITKKIQDGEYAPGEKLSEARLSKDLNVSRNTVREALRSLARSGLVEFETNKGARVIRLNRQDVADLFALREVVEGLAAYLAATNINHPGHRDLMAKMLQEVQTIKEACNKGESFNYQEHNENFHNVIMDLSQNKYVMRTISEYHVPALRPQYFNLLDRGDLYNSILEHEEIVFAILDGDAVKSEKLMRTHVRHAIRQVHRLSDCLFNQVYGTH